jgi:hypothetical protein
MGLFRGQTRKIVLAYTLAPLRGGQGVIPKKFWFKVSRKLVKLANFMPHSNLSLEEMENEKTDELSSSTDPDQQPSLSEHQQQQQQLQSSLSPDPHQREPLTTTTTGEESYLKRELYQRMSQEPSLFDWLQQSSIDGLWYWDLERPENEWLSPEFKALFGYKVRASSSLLLWQGVICY